MAFAEEISFEDATTHKRVWSGPWSKAIWVEDAGGLDLAVIHWMGGAYKVVGRYRSASDNGIELARQHAMRLTRPLYAF